MLQEGLATATRFVSATVPEVLESPAGAYTTIVEIVAPLSAPAGARVDVVASSGEGLTGTTALVVADAEVLAVAVSPPPAGFEGSVGEALLRVSSRQALRITAALNFSREVRLLARPADELGPPDGPRAVAAP